MKTIERKLKAQVEPGGKVPFTRPKDIGDLNDARLKAATFRTSSTMPIKATETGFDINVTKRYITVTLPRALGVAKGETAYLTL